MERRETRKLTVTGPGQTCYLTIPRSIIKKLGWKKGEKKIISQKGDKVIIEDWKQES